MARKMCLSDLLLQGTKLTDSPSCQLSGSITVFVLRPHFLSGSAFCGYQCKPIPIGHWTLLTGDFSSRAPILTETFLALLYNLRFFLPNSPFSLSPFLPVPASSPLFFRHFPNKSLVCLILFWHLLPGRPELTRPGTVWHSPQSSLPWSPLFWKHLSGHIPCNIH